MKTGQKPSPAACLFAVLASVLIPALASAQQRPLTVEDPETIGNGRVLMEGGIAYERGVEQRVYGLEGNQWRVPSIGLSFGLGSIADLQLDSGWNRMLITERTAGPLSDALDIAGDRTSAVEDVVVATKIRIVPEAIGRPSFGVRFATKLPNASTESGLGTDMTDFSMTLLIGKTTGPVRFVGNVGFAILGDPTRLGTQHDPVVFGISAARAVTSGFEVVGELTGRWLPSESDAPAAENRAALRGGLRYTVGTVRMDGGLLVGVAGPEPSLGFTTGVTWVFDAFRTP
jgi:hypothetical protein